MRAKSTAKFGDRRPVIGRHQLGEVLRSSVWKCSDGVGHRWTSRLLQRLPATFSLAGIGCFLTTRCAVCASAMTRVGLHITYSAATRLTNFGDVVCIQRRL